MIILSEHFKKHKSTLSRSKFLTHFCIPTLTHRMKRAVFLSVSELLTALEEPGVLKVTDGDSDASDGETRGWARDTGRKWLL